MSRFLMGALFAFYRMESRVRIAINCWATTRLLLLDLYAREYFTRQAAIFKRREVNLNRYPLGLD